MSSRKQKVFVGISGGVDSSVAAYMLKKEGYDVHGIFVKTWSPEWLPCTWIDEKRDAMRVCAALDIPFHYLDAEEEYKKGVADYMIAEYKAGRTPNPDVLCNRIIKFGAMWKYAKSQGAELLATGHYAQIKDNCIAKGTDMAKDQSYFLWMLTKEDVSHTLFPIGSLPKNIVRSIAKKAGLFTTTKKDSQGICFLGDVDMREFLAHYIEQTPGPVVTPEGEVIGEHDGVLFYTFGERRGFRITTKSDERPPLYVVGKNLETNTLIVSPERKIAENKGCQQVVLRDVQWNITPKRNDSYEGQIRYHGSFLAIHIESETEVTIETAEPLPLGQSLVIYRGDTIVGGGIIDRVY